MPLSKGYVDEKIRYFLATDASSMFLLNYRTRIKEARPIIKEIINSLRRISNNACVIVSFNYTLPSEYYQMLIPYFDKCIHITNDESDNSLIVEGIPLQEKR